MTDETIHGIGMRAAVAPAKAPGPDEERVGRAIAAHLKVKAEVLVGRPMLSRLYQFLHHAWIGHGEGRDEGSFAKDLHDWREEIYAYHSSDFRT